MLLFRQVRLLLVIILGGLGLSFVYISCAQISDTATSLHCDGNATTIVELFRLYAKHHGRLPPAVGVDAQSGCLHSWRVLLLEFLDRETLLSYRFDKPWNSPENLALESRIPRCYTCPVDRKGRSHAWTSYCVAIAPRAVYVGAQVPLPLAQFQNPPPRLLLIEVAASGIHWLEPREFDTEVDSLVTNVWSEDRLSPRSFHRSGVLVGFSDSTRERLGDSAESIARLAAWAYGNER